MADRYPLIYNPTANQIQELQSGDSLDLGNAGLKNVTEITAVGFKTSTGTSSQFLKADGSIDSNTYLTSAGTIALAQGLTGSPSITVGAVSGTTGTFSGNVSAVNVSASSSVTAATFYGDGQNLTNTGSTLSASSGTQRVVLTGQTSGTMTASATDSDLTYDSSTNTLNVLNLNVQGTTTTIDTAVTGVDSLTVDGSVGIGTTNPQKTLEVFDGDIFLNSTDKKIFLTSDYDQYITANASSNYLVFGTGNTERLRITSGGFVGINKNNPLNQLHIRGENHQIRIEDSLSGDNAQIQLDGPNDNFNLDWVSSNPRKINLINSGSGAISVGIANTNPTSTLHVTGDVLVTGIGTAIQWDATSDIALKENIEVIDNPIGKLSELKGVTFDWKFGGHSVGVIAQDVEKVLPTAVGGSIDHKTVNYNAIIGLLVESVKDQQKQIEELKALLDK